MTHQLTINGITYNVTKVRAFSYDGTDRHEISLQRPKGTKRYTVVVYANGAMSPVIG